MRKKTVDFLVPINNICNQKCIFCSAKYRMKGNKSIPLKVIFKKILEKDNYIQISGGEPLLSKDLYKILYFIRKTKPNCFIELQTNGVFLLENNNLDKLEKFNIGLYNINYPSHIEEINDQIVGVKGTLQKREMAMKEIIKRGLKLRINIIVTRTNYAYLPDMIEYIYREFRGLDRIQISFVKAMGAAKDKEIVPRYEEVSPFVVLFLEKAERYSIKVDVDHIPICFLGSYIEHHVDYHKIVKGIKGVYLEEKNYVKRCKGCDKRKICSGYRNDYLKIYPEDKYE